MKPICRKEPRSVTNRDRIRGTRELPGRVATDRWSRLVHDDMIGIDADIEKLLRAVLKRNGGTRASASAELVRGLSR
jgi:hypothetical protein